MSNVAQIGEQRTRSAPALILPGATDRTVVIGATGTGKTTAGAWLLSRQRLDKRPWILLDYKDEELWERIGAPYIQDLKLGSMPSRRGLYRVRVLPGQDDETEDFLWKLWKREDCGIFADEIALVPKGPAIKAICRQGRSKRLPLIACTQRPNGVDREIFTEATYKMVFALEDRRDVKIVQEYSRGIPDEFDLPRHCSYWYDGKRRLTFTLQPVPGPGSIAAELRAKAPVGWW